RRRHTRFSRDWSSDVCSSDLTIEFNEDVVAFIPTRHLEKEDGKKLKKGDSAEFKIIEFNKEFKRVVASHTAMFREEEEKIAKEAEANTSNTQVEKTTLGDIDALAELKERMEKGK